MSDKKKKYNKAKFYNIENDNIVRTHKFCPKCGLGIFMADHKDRYSCGKCNYTVWK